MTLIHDIIRQFKTIKLNIWDRLFLIIFTCYMIYLIILGMSILTFGGIVLIYGAFLTYKGQIFLSAGCYILADLSWVSNAYYSHDIQGVIFITIGILFGIVATIKMQTGKMQKDLN